MLGIFLQTLPANIPTDNDGFSVLLWGVCIVVPALVAAIGVLWSAKSKAEKEHKVEIKGIVDAHALELKGIVDAHALELKAERDYIKQEGKEQAQILNGLSSVLNDLTRGMEKDLPKEIDSVKALIDARSNEIKENISRLGNGS